MPFQKLFGADDTAFGGDENFEHGELLAGERDVAVVAVDLARNGSRRRPAISRTGGLLCARLRSSALSLSTSSRNFERLGERDASGDEIAESIVASGSGSAC